MQKKNTPAPGESSTSANIPRLDYDSFLEARARAQAAHLTRDGDTPDQSEARYIEQLESVREHYEEWRALGNFYADALDDEDTPAELERTIQSDLDDLQHIAQISFSGTDTLREFYPLLRFLENDDPHGIKYNNVRSDHHVKRYFAERDADHVAEPDAPTEPRETGEHVDFVEYLSVILTHPAVPRPALNFLRGQFDVLANQANLSLEHPQIVRTAARLIFDYHGRDASNTIYEMLCDGVEHASGGNYGQVLKLFSTIHARPPVALDTEPAPRKRIIFPTPPTQDAA